jgi:hypothetical protein
LLGSRNLMLGPVLALPDAANGYQDVYIRRIADSFARVTGESLPLQAQPGRDAWFGNFALLSHRGDAAATLNYANAFALKLWEYDWEDFTGLPSEVTAPPDDRVSRAVAMTKVARDNFVRGYSGRRISATGRLFTIADGIIWRLLDADGTSFGVGAFFRSVR